MKSFFKTLLVILIPAAVIGALYMELKSPRKQQALSREIRGLEIDISKGNTDVERTAIIKFNNMIDAYAIATSHFENGAIDTEQGKDAELRAMRLSDEFTFYVDRNEKIINHELYDEFLARMKDFQLILIEKFYDQHTRKKD